MKIAIVWVVMFGIIMGGSVLHAETVTWDGSGDMTWTNPDSNSWGGKTYDNGDDAQFTGSGTGKVNIPGTVSPNSVSVSADGYIFDGAGNISGATALSQSGAGKLIVSNANTYAGGTTIGDGSDAGGSIEITNDEALGTGSISINGNKLRLNNVTLDEAITVDAYAGGGAITSAGGSNTLTGTVTLNESCDVRGNNITWSGGIVSTANKGIGINGSKHVIDTKPINLGTGNLGFTSAGNNPVSASLLNVVSNVFGQLTINFGGYLTLGVFNALPSDVDLKFGWHTNSSSSGTLDLNGYDQTVESIHHSLDYGDPSPDQNITGGGTLTVNLASGTKEYWGRITDGVTPTALIKNGAGTQILNNLSGIPSDYSGVTTVNGGVLQLDGVAPVGSLSPVTVASGATLRLAGGSVAFGSLAGAGTVENVGVVEPLIDEDFSSSNVTYYSTRVWEDQIDDGWITCHDAEWFVTNGVVQNAATTAGGYPEARPAEGAFAQVVANTLGGPEMTLSFDYDVAAGDTLYTHFWGYTGVVSGADMMLMNTEPCDGVCANLDTNTAPGNSTLDAFNLKDGASFFHGSPATAISGGLTDSGSYTVTVAVADLGIPGVDSLDAFSYIGLVFCKEEDGLAGTTTIDNVLITTDQTTLTVGGDNTGTTFSGALLEDSGGGTVGLMKVGTNVLSLAGTNVYSGSTTVNGGTLEIAGAGLTSTNGTLGVWNGSTFRVCGTGADIHVGEMESGGTAGNTLTFALGADGVSTLNIATGVCALADIALIIDGSSYAGKAADIVLIDCPELVSVSTDVTVMGFEPGKYIPELVQDQDADEVRLMIQGGGVVFIVR